MALRWSQRTLQKLGDVAKEKIAVLAGSNDCNGAVFIAN